MGKLVPLLLAVIGAVSSSCSTVRYYVNVSSISSGEDSGRRVAILPLDQKVSLDDLQFREFSRYLEKAMASKGYVVTQERASAQVFVLLGYAISDPQERQTTTIMPMTSYQSGQTVNSYAYSGGYSAYGTATSSGTYSTTYVPMTSSYTTYTRLIKISAFDVRVSKEKPKQLWETTISSTGSSGDLRQVFPMMLAASMEHIGTNTRSEINTEIAERDPRIAEILGVNPSRTPAKE